jgi:hypothetical protein
MIAPVVSWCTWEDLKSTFVEFSLAPAAEGNNGGLGDFAGGLKIGHELLHVVAGELNAAAVLGCVTEVHDGVFGCVAQEAGGIHLCNVVARGQDFEVRFRFFVG